MKIFYLLVNIVQAQFPIFLTKEALLNRCKQFAISDDDCMNSTYLPQKEYNNYLKSFNVPIIKDDYCNEGKCIAVIYKDEHKCTQCKDKNCLTNCRRVIHTDNIVQQPVPPIQKVDSIVPSSNTVTITRELTKTIDIPKTTTLVDTVKMMSTSVNVVTSTLVSSIPTTSVLTVTKTDISTLSKISTTTSTSTTSVKISTAKIKTVTVTKEQESSSVDETEVDNTQTVEKAIATTIAPSSRTSLLTNPQTIPTSIITVTREVPTTVTVDRPLTLYREVTTTLTSEVPIVNYKVTTFTKNLISTIEKTSTYTTTERSYITEFGSLTSIITSISTKTLTATLTSKESASVNIKDTKSLFENLVGQQDKAIKESQISPTVKISTKIETVVSTLTKPASFVTKEIVSTVTKELTKSLEPATSTVSAKCTENCDVKKDDEIDKLIPLLKELLVKEEKTTKKKKKHKSTFINPETVIDRKKPKTVVKTVYSRRKKVKCMTKKANCIDCDSTCEDSSEIIQGSGKR